MYQPEEQEIIQVSFRGVVEGGHVEVRGYAPATATVVITTDNGCKVTIEGDRAQVRRIIKTVRGVAL